MNETTHYSAQIEGDRGNWRRPVQFDRTDGYIGITQFNEDGGVDRVLLSPAQVRQLKTFLRVRAAAPEAE